MRERGETDWHVAYDLGGVRSGSINDQHVALRNEQHAMHHREHDHPTPEILLAAFPRQNSHDKTDNYHESQRAKQTVEVSATGDGRNRVEHIHKLSSVPVRVDFEVHGLPLFLELVRLSKQDVPIG